MNKEEYIKYHSECNDFIKGLDDKTIPSLQIKSMFEGFQYQAELAQGKNFNLSDGYTDKHDNVMERVKDMMDMWKVNSKVSGPIETLQILRGLATTMVSLKPGANWADLSVKPTNKIVDASIVFLKTDIEKTIKEICVKLKDSLHAEFNPEGQHKEVVNTKEHDAGAIIQKLISYTQFLLLEEMGPSKPGLTDNKKYPAVKDFLWKLTKIEESTSSANEKQTQYLQALETFKKEIATIQKSQTLFGNNSRWTTLVNKKIEPILEKLPELTLQAPRNK